MNLLEAIKKYGAEKEQKDDDFVQAVKHAMQKGASINPGTFNKIKWDENNPIVIACQYGDNPKITDVLDLLFDPNKQHKFKNRFDWVCIVCNYTNNL